MCKFGVFFKKSISFLLAVLSFVICSSAAYPNVSASSAVLINADTEEVFFSKDSFSKREMASTTKIMTAIVAIEHGSLDEKIKIPSSAIGVEGSSLYLKEGEEMTLRELLYGLMLGSANDAAEAIAVIICGSVDSFADLMNEKAADIGLENTHFTNPHGLSEDGHYTTAFDLAKLAAYALKNETFREICSTRKISLPGNRLVVNHNKLLFSFDGACGVKTGFTKNSGRCLVSAAERDGITLVAVTLNAPNDWNDHADMLEYGFLEYELVTLAETGEALFSLPIIGGEVLEINVAAEADVSVCLKKNRGSVVEHLEIIRPRFAPVYKGEPVGRVVYTLDGKEIASSPLVATEYVGVKRDTQTFLDKLFSIFK